MVAYRPGGAALPFPHTYVTASYEKFLSQGSGFFAGADTQMAEVTARRPFGRTYEFLMEGGYSRNMRLQPSELWRRGGECVQRRFRWSGAAETSEPNLGCDGGRSASRSSISTIPSGSTGSTGKTNTDKSARSPSSGIRRRFESSNFWPKNFWATFLAATAAGNGGEYG